MSGLAIYIPILILAILCTVLTVTFVYLAIKMTSRKNILLFFTVNFLIINLIHVISYVLLRYPTSNYNTIENNKTNLINSTSNSTSNSTAPICEFPGALLVFSAVSQE